ncbi:hypothetical protein J1605_009684 [Eschrichtius robustus]|uniref:Uncharacterized protein n=1 Tax=Eschrichtius robustus TaxID=9764 RepID=A0AB34GUD3_ESCRO|nr:hypothetical protein J1605_009684 [Eschrichtius robustus]
MNPDPPPAGQILPCDQLGPGPTYYQANTSLKTPWTLEPTVSGSGPTHQQFDTSSGTPGPCNQTPGSSSAHQYHQLIANYEKKNVKQISNSTNTTLDSDTEELEEGQPPTSPYRAPNGNSAQAENL